MKVLTRRSVSPYVCKVCGQSFPTHIAVIMHRANGCAELGESNLLFRCAECGTWVIGKEVAEGHEHPMVDVYRWAEGHVQ